MTKTWRERELEARGYISISPASNMIYMQAEIDELRAELKCNDDGFNAMFEEVKSLKRELIALKNQEPIGHVEINHMVEVRFHSNCEYGCALENGAKLYLSAGANN